MKNTCLVFRSAAAHAMRKYKVGLVLLPLVLCGVSACTLDMLDPGYGSGYPNGRRYPSYEKPEPPVRRGYTEMQAAFAPWDDVERPIVKAIDEAREQVLVQAYVLSNGKIVDALIRAHARRVDVRVLVDRVQMSKRPSRVSELAHAGIPVRLETRYKSAHNKLIVIDPDSSSDGILITGSMNFSDTSPRANAENVLVINGQSNLVQDYASNWKRHAKDATPYHLPGRKHVKNPAVTIPIIVPMPVLPPLR